MAHNRNSTTYEHKLQRAINRTHGTTTNKSSKRIFTLYFRAPYNVKLKNEYQI